MSAIEWNCKASVSQFWMTMNAYLNTFRSVKHSNRAMSWNTWDISAALFPVLHVLWPNNMVSAVKNSSWNPWKCHFWESKYQNVPRRLGPQELVPLLRVPKLPTIDYRPATQKIFDNPADYIAPFSSFI